MQDEVTQIARRHIGDAARPQQLVFATIVGGDLDRAFDDLHSRVAVVDRHAEGRALDHGGEIRGLYAEMRGRHLLDAEDDVAEPFDHLDETAGRRRIGDLQARGRRYDSILLAAHQNGTRIGTGDDRVADRESIVSACRADHTLVQDERAARRL
jgi:hypothetical protein